MPCPLSSAVSLDILQKSKAIDILLALSESREPLAFMKLKDACGGSVGILSVRVAELRAEGLISEEIENKFQGRRLISLTKRGKLMAELLYKIEEI